MAWVLLCSHSHFYIPTPCAFPWPQAYPLKFDSALLYTFFCPESNRLSIHWCIWSKDVRKRPSFVKMHGERQWILTRHQQVRKMSLDICQPRKWVRNEPQDLPSSHPHCAFPGWFTGMAPRTWQRGLSSGRWKHVFMPALSLFLFVLSWVVTINCAMRAVQRWVYRETSTNPSSAFSPSFLEAIVYHISPALFLTARIKVDFTTRSPQCPPPPPPNEDRRWLVVSHQQNHKTCVRKPIHLVFVKPKDWSLK